MMRVLAVALLLTPTVGLKARAVHDQLKPKGKGNAKLKAAEKSDNPNGNAWCEGGRIMPSLHLLGAQKAGSTSLYRDLIRRFDMSPAEVISVDKNTKEADWMSKEVSFFADEPRFKRGRNFYLRHYPHCKDKGKAARGIDASIAFDHGDDYINRLADFYGDKAKDLKFIVIVRDPVTRMESEFHHGEQMIGNLADTGGLTKKVQQESKFEKYVERALMEDGAATQWSKGNQTTEPPQYFKGSSYAYMMKNWLKRFDASQFTVVTLKQYQGKTAATLKFIGDRMGMKMIDQGELSEHMFANENKNKHKPMRKDLHLKLSKYFDPLDEEWKKIMEDGHMGMEEATLKHKPARELWEHEAASPTKGRKIDQEWEGSNGKIYGSGGI